MRMKIYLKGKEKRFHKTDEWNKGRWVRRIEFLIFLSVRIRKKAARKLVLNSVGATASSQIVKSLFTPKDLIVLFIFRLFISLDYQLMVCMCYPSGPRGYLRFAYLELNMKVFNSLLNLLGNEVDADIIYHFFKSGNNLLLCIKRLSTEYTGQDADSAPLSWFL